jgi:Caspase domain/OmpA family
MKRKFFIGLLLLAFTPVISQQNKYAKGNKFPIKNIVFEVGKTRMAPLDSANDLDDLAKVMVASADMKIAVMGHTDVVGDATLNLKLSEARAETVKNYLVSKGVSKRNIKTQGFGGTRPLVSESSPLNRRIEILISESSYVKKEMSVTDTVRISSKLVETKPLVKLALLIGNSDYKNSPKLKNPTNDVELMDETLSSLGFNVFKYKNAGHQTMINAMKEFQLKLNGADVVVFYFAGHGLQHEGKNYLLPIDVTLKNGPMDLAFEALNAELVTQILEYTNNESLKMIILDACRSNPYATWGRDTGNGLAELKPKNGTVIGFATSPGSIAFDGDGKNGIYTAELSKQLLVSQRIEDVFMNTRIAVETKTNNSQSPWELLRLRSVYMLRK